ncbi:MAG: class II fructose-bisphosphate aldolase [Candidatus Micrarchaeia archaeon]|jgi:fructose-bisphosphate aldolase class II
MVLENAGKMLLVAQRRRFAVPAFNCHNLEILRAVIQAAEARKSPVIVAATEKTIEYASLELLAPLFLAAARNASVPVAVHLDHGKNISVVKRCLDAGFNSIMFDGSQLSFEENVRLTKQAAALAHERGASCEGEVGTIGKVEDEPRKRRIALTDAEAASEFTERTGVDALAVAIGTSHGAFKFSGEARLDLARLKEIKRKTRIPLVLHGASVVPLELVRLANKHGAKIKGAKGVPPEQVREAVKLGVCKVNVDTDLRLAFTAGVRERLSLERGELDPREICLGAAELVRRTAEKEMVLVGSAGATRFFKVVAR